MYKLLRLVPWALFVAVSGDAAYADSDAGRVQALERQIQALQARVAELEARWTFTSFMPNFAERFHVMHLAGEAGDWAVASHELAEMKRLASMSTSFDVQKGKLMQGMMSPRFEALEAAIEHGNGKKFESALVQTVDTCNACHSATGSSFIEVTLNVPDVLSLRHPHKLTPRSVPGGHTHAHPAASHTGQATGGHAEPDEHPHDDEGKPEHKD